ncbi:hypothetical protein [Bernardetia litoralis]|uniref:hypothetical protein n=1 Tax=Bernardetia litoralis TaxID=999 RepID=UPI0002DC51A9|nr:hypothetical protein [Bernardetia litoralis]
MRATAGGAKFYNSETKYASDADETVKASSPSFINKKHTRTVSNTNKDTKSKVKAAWKLDE